MTQQQINDLKQSLISLINSKLADQSTIIASEHRDVETAIVDSIFTDKSLIGDIKEIACNQQYIIDNFEPISNTLEEGKAFSTSERVGWAICNGKNGTVNKMGRVAIGYDPINYQLGSVAGSNTGGSKNAVLIGHEHDSIVYNNGQKGVNQLGTGTSIYGWAIGGGNATEKTNKTSKNGISNTGSTSNNETGTDKNMQPYIVTLFIQKIS